MNPTPQFCKKITIKNFVGDKPNVFLGLLEEDGDFIVLKTRNHTHRFHRSLILGMEDTSVVFDDKNNGAGK